MLGPDSLNPSVNDMLVGFSVIVHAPCLRNFGIFGEERPSCPLSYGIASSGVSGPLLHKVIHVSSVQERGGVWVKGDMRGRKQLRQTLPTCFLEPGSQREQPVVLLGWWKGYARSGPGCRLPPLLLFCFFCGERRL